MNKKGWKQEAKRLEIELTELRNEFEILQADWEKNDELRYGISKLLIEHDVGVLSSMMRLTGLRVERVQCNTLTE